MADLTSVFVSATSRDLRTARAKVAAKLRALGHHTVEQPDFATDHRTIRAMLLDKITRCDAVVHVAGFVYGAEPLNRPPDAPRRSYTQLEYEIAVELKKPVFVFLANAAFPFDTHDPDPADLCQLQTEHRTRLEQRDNLWYAFATEAELLDRIALIRLPERPDTRPRKPNNLPYNSLGDLFKGRDSFVTRLRETLVAKPAHAAVVAAKQAIHGLGGVGKTRLAIEYGWRFQDQYAALLFVSADSPESLRRGLAALCRAEILNLSERDAREEEVQVAAAVRWLEGHPGWFLILDNSDTPEAATAVEQLLPRVANGHVVITSRIADWDTSGAVAMELDVLDERPAADFLLARTAGKRRTTPTDDADALALANDLDGLALALEQAGAFVAKHRCSLADYRTRWAAQEPKVLEWYDPRVMKYPRSVAVTWQTSIDQLTDDGRSLLNVLAWLAPDPIPVDMILIKPRDDKPNTVTFDFEAALADLGSFSMVKWETDGQTVIVHRLVQDVSRYRTPDADRRGWIEVALRMVNRFLSGDPGDVRTWGVWEAIHHHVELVSELGEQFGIANPTSRLMNQLALYFAGRAAYAAAEPLMRRALAIDEQCLGHEHPDIATNLNNIATLLMDTNRLNDAEPLMRQALSILEHCFGLEHPKVAAQLSNLAHLLQVTNQLKDAEPLMYRAISIFEGSFGTNHPDLAMALNNLGDLLKVTNRLADAEPVMRRTLAIDEHCYGTQHPTVARDLNNLAQLLQTTNRVAEAEPIMRRALAIDEHCYGTQHPTVAIRLSNLAQLLEKSGRLHEAEPLMRRVISIFEVSLGFDHHKVATALSNLAGLLHDTNRLNEAEPLMQRSLAIDEYSFGPGHPKVATRLNNLALLLMDTNRLAEAEPLMWRALAIDEESYGPQHPIVARDLNNLAQLFQATNRLAEAEPLMRRALVIDEESYGPRHPRVATRLNSLACLLQTTNRLIEAEPLIRRALAIDEKSFGLQHPKVANRLNNLAQLLQDTNRLDEAELQMRRALALDEQYYGPQHPDVARDLSNLASLLQITNRLDEAEPLHQRALRIWHMFRLRSGHIHPNFNGGLRNYRYLLEARGLSEPEIEANIRALLGLPPDS